MRKLALLLCLACQGAADSPAEAAVGEACAKEDVD
eukprot:CAMPEP_0170617476 /NCGR_PEP_ID=MMETSP0224-20130122/26441_1 /TAXON_ID=285029 /ORGANISM="Togula jolla, Strain CCCM 725" /LENGTH=34 /DNA_ID= /DNA_START= /DNA_END= /DNA_ORIENTATION=